MSTWCSAMADASRPNSAGPMTYARTGDTAIAATVCSDHTTTYSSPRPNRLDPAWPASSGSDRTGRTAAVVGSVSLDTRMQTTQRSPLRIDNVQHGGVAR